MHLNIPHALCHMWSSCSGGWGTEGKGLTVSKPSCSNPLYLTVLPELGIDPRSPGSQPSPCLKELCLQPSLGGQGGELMGVGGVAPTVRWAPRVGRAGMEGAGMPAGLVQGQGYMGLGYEGAAVALGGGGCLCSKVLRGPSPRCRAGWQCQASPFSTIRVFRSSRLLALACFSSSSASSIRFLRNAEIRRDLKSVSSCLAEADSCSKR